MKKLILVILVLALVLAAAIPSYAADDVAEYAGYTLLLQIPNFANMFIENGIQRWDVPQVLIYDIQANRVICVTSETAGLNTIFIDEDGIHYNIIADATTSTQTFTQLGPTDFGVEQFATYQPASFSIIPYTENMIVMYNEYVPVNAAPANVNFFPYLPSGQPGGVTVPNTVVRDVLADGGQFLRGFIGILGASAEAFLSHSVLMVFIFAIPLSVGAIALVRGLIKKRKR